MTEFNSDKDSQERIRTAATRYQEALMQVEIASSQYQYEIERSVAKDPEGVAIFFLTKMDAAFSFNPEDTFQDKGGLFKLKPKGEFPKGVMPHDLADNPAYLSSILARTNSLREMLEAGVQLTVLTVDEGRTKYNEESRNKVVPAKGSILENEEYRKKFDVYRITWDWYEEVQTDRVGSANYRWQKEDEPAAAVFLNTEVITSSYAFTRFNVAQDTLREIKLRTGAGDLSRSSWLPKCNRAKGYES